MYARIIRAWQETARPWMQMPLTKDRFRVATDLYDVDVNKE
jgi:hypothetical protein